MSSSGGKVKGPGPKPTQAEAEKLRAQGKAQAREAKMISMISALKVLDSSDEQIVKSLLDGGFSAKEIAGKGYHNDVIAKVEKSRKGSAYVTEAKIVAPKPEPKPGHPLFPAAMAAEKEVKKKE